MENEKMREKIQEIPEIAKVSSKGQIVIPADIRERLGIREGSVFAVSSLDGNMVVMKKVENPVKADDMELLAGVKKAWEEFDNGKYKTYTVPEFMRKLNKMGKEAGTRANKRSKGA